MTQSPERDPISGPRRLARVAAAVGVVAALSAAGPVPLAAAADAPPVPAAEPGVKSAHNKLGSDDADTLAEAKADGAKNVTMMIATAPGRTEQVTKELNAVKGGSVGRSYDKVGYVRATVPTGKADAAIKAAAKLSSVHAIDLMREIPLDDPTPDAGTTATSHKGKGKGKNTYPGPGKDTPAENPYNPSFETGAVDFVKKHPKADGRGITIGILDSGVDLGHPALQKTTTGERKVVDWVTATDPILDGDATWRPMVTAVSGPDFSYAGRAWKAPAGSYEISTFKESATTGGDEKGDLNRDGDTTDSWGVLYDPAAGTVTLDLDNDHDFTNDTPMKPYKDGYQVGYFGTDDPKTDVVERVPFVVQIRKDVAMDPYGGSWVGKKADFVNIGVIESEHGTHVAGITAANGLFGGTMNGAAPGAQIVSSRACTWSGGCTNVALTEGMIDLVTNRSVDVVNMSIGGLPALNDGNNARAELYTRLIDTYGVQLVISAGNSGPGANTIGDPGLADKVISVGAAISRQTWAANYGSRVKRRYQLLPFSSRGPREDGGFTPTLVAPGAAINSTQTWLPGSPVPEAGYSLPAGYSMLQGTSMASPQATGASALLLSAARQKGIDLTPAKLRTALTSTADHIRGVQAYEEGAGLIDIVDAWRAIRHNASAHDYTVKAPVDTAIDFALKTPGFGTGLYDREGGLKAGQKKTYDITVTRTSGPDQAVRHKLHFKNNAGHTFRIVGDDVVRLPLNQPVTVKVRATPRSAGIKSAILEVDDPRTKGIDKQILTTVVVSTPLHHTHTVSGSVQRNSTRSYFLTVPEGAKSLEIAMGGLKDRSQTRFIAIHPYGVPVDNTSTPYCYNNYLDGKGCRPDVRSYSDPQPGVWEVEVEARRTSPMLNNPYRLEFSVLGARFAPETVTVPEAKVGSPVTATWTVTNAYAALDGKLVGGPLGSAKTARPSIGQGETQTTTVDVPAGAKSLDVAIGNVSDTAADLDLTVYDASGKQVAQSADGDSEEAVSIPSPAAGTYTIEVAGYSVPAGSTDYDYRDVFFSSALGTVSVDGTTPVKLDTGDSATVTGQVTAAAEAPAGREFFGRVQLVNARGTVAGIGSVKIEKVTP
ncbi:serine protease [Streptomyces pluripotens]|uniref:Serine protease n=1 Tax=Streptomyces pluripotens TaxID=1355015 RepID=A0A221P990_9ACTN|nr:MULTISPECIES: S8 family serine peptidase [Streptomyces]ARP74072.1 serine protease [Streptomyces pluripotens]ASN28335.1 serine protease [Streptomyces pluripotens]KIE28097.1 serine protease [Streptomyces sp. MUSC 125]MCH0558333.1 S8 family serine peptidase [Streptomyces sp. MUM 16J]